MRRMAPPARINVDRRSCTPFCRVFRGASGLGLVEDSPPDSCIEGATPLAPVVGAPYPTESMSVTAGGRIVLGWGEGVARTILIPDLAQAFDRRPPGLTDALGAADANAALLHAADGWRAVVLPSMGDRLADLGEGPVAISPDGLKIAAAGDGVIVEMALADGSELARHEGRANCLVYTGAGELQLGEPGVVCMASGAEVVVAVHDDGTVGVVGDDRRWTPPRLGEIRNVGVSADGAWAAISGTEAVAVVRATDGAVAARIAGATAIGMVAGGRIAIGGTWGVALLGTPEDTQ
ncbi:MAG: hypothetical protein R2878_11425 [Thermoleophilia bacterium]